MGEFISYFLSPLPLLSLVSFMIVPAPKRIVFEVGAGLVWSTTFGAFLKVFFPWLINLEVVREGMRNAKEAPMNVTTAGNASGMIEHEL